MDFRSHNLLWQREKKLRKLQILPCVRKSYKSHWQLPCAGKTRCIEDPGTICENYGKDEQQETGIAAVSSVSILRRFGLANSVHGVDLSSPVVMFTRPGQEMRKRPCVVDRVK